MADKKPSASVLNKAYQRQEKKAEQRLKGQGLSDPEVRDAIAQSPGLAAFRGAISQAKVEEDKEEDSEDIRVLESFLNPIQPDDDDEEQEEEEPAKPAGPKFVGSVKARLGKIPAPESVAFPLLAVLVMLFFVQPINGKTRVAHLWAVLNGKEALGTSGSVGLFGARSGSSPPGGQGSIGSVGLFGARSGSSPPGGAGSGEYQGMVIPIRPSLAWTEEGTS